jgi:hypothetical protein
MEDGAPEHAEIGVTYKVTFDDCCVKGSFTSALTAKNYVPDPPETEPFLESVTFANGVTLTEWLAVTLTHGSDVPDGRDT